MRRRRASRYLAAAALLIGAATRTVGAADTTWLNTTGNNQWGDPANWNGGVPDTTKTAFIAVGGTIDLGGVSRTAQAIQPQVSVFTLANGHLDTTRVFGDAAVDYQASLGAIGPLLNLRQQFLSTFRGGIGDGQGGGDFALVASGTLSSLATHGGATHVHYFTIAGDGAITRSPTINIVSGGLSLDNTSANSPQINRLSDSAPIHLRNGGLGMSGIVGLPVTETVGTIELAAGHSGIDVGALGLPVEDPPLTQTLIAAGLTRERLGTVRIDVAQGNATRIQLLNTPATTGGGAGATQLPILPYATGPFRYRLGNGALASPLSFFTYDAGPTSAPEDDIGLRPLDVRTEYTTQISPGTSASNVRIPAARNLAADATINALAIEAGQLTLDNNAALTISSGGMIVGATTTTSFSAVSGTGRLIFPDEALITTRMLDETVRAKIDVPIQANALIVYGGSFGPLVLNRPNTYSGGTHVNGAILGSGAQGAIGGGSINVLAGGLLFTNVSQTYANPLILGEAIDDFGAPTGFTPEIRLDADAGVQATFTSTVTSFTPKVFKRGGGLLRFDNGYSTSVGGTLRIDDGTLVVNGTMASTSPGQPLSIDFREEPGTFIGSGTLAGNGTILATVSGGRIAPGDNGVGRIAIGKLAIDNVDHTSQFIFDIRGPGAGVGYDQLITMSPSELDAELMLISDFIPPLGSTYLIIDNQFNGLFTSRFDNAPQNGIVTASNGAQFRITYLAGEGNDVLLTAVPEPGTLGLLFAPAVAIALFARSRRPPASASRASRAPRAMRGRGANKNGKQGMARSRDARVRACAEAHECVNSTRRANC